LDVYFRIDSRVNISLNALKELKKRGCVGVTFGIESFSDETLKNMNKGNTREMIIKTLKNSHEAGLWTRGTFILLWPGETIENFKKNTLRFTKFVDEFEAHILHILPGTPIYEKLKQRGEINDDIWFKNRARKIFYCKENFSSSPYALEELEKVFWYANNYYVVKKPENIFKKFDLFRSSVLISGSLVNMAASVLDKFVSIDKMLKFEKKYYGEFQKKMLKSVE
jgi:radical SAM superfamily enzyme YgiQ (UPF0313 family)